MRFILNFFFFGFIFYLIYLYFPEAFHTLATWAQAAFDFLRDAFNSISDRVGHGQVSSPPPVVK